MHVFIHRKDLRISDMPAFDYLRQIGKPSLHILILDPLILKKNRHLEHSGVQFLQVAMRLKSLYAKAQQSLHIVYGDPAAVIARLHVLQPIEEIVFHRDVTPYAQHRDRALLAWSKQSGVKCSAMDDQMMTSPEQFDAFAGRTEPYKVYTPFWKKWREMMNSYATPPSKFGIEGLQTLDAPTTWINQFAVPDEIFTANPKLESWQAIQPMAELQTFIQQRLGIYETARDDFAHAHTSGISKYLNTGALSIREVWAALPTDASAEPWCRQLAWREFYYYQAYRDPQFFNYEKSFQSDKLSDQHFAAWAKGETGIPIIDAAMRHLNATGDMHNRLRMVTAMFLTKNLLCPFQLGETYFRYKLNDYDNTLNRGGWLWSSSIGFDAAPYFRIMSPVLQSQRFNPSGDYIRRWMPELAHLSDKAIHLPQPNAIVDLKSSRARAIEVYGELLKSKSE
jgi:deoxyribodipyrimidine photo-lyase